MNVGRKKHVKWAKRQKEIAERNEWEKIEKVWVKNRIRQKERNEWKNKSARIKKEKKILIIKQHGYKI